MFFLKNCFFILLCIYFVSCQNSSNENVKTALLNQAIEQTNNHLENYSLFGIQNNIRKKYAFAPQLFLQQYQDFELIQSKVNQFIDSLPKTDSINEKQFNELVENYSLTILAIENTQQCTDGNSFQNEYLIYRDKKVAINAMLNDILMQKYQKYICLQKQMAELNDENNWAFSQIRFSKKNAQTILFYKEILQPPYQHRIKIDSIFHNQKKTDNIDFSIEKNEWLGSIYFQSLTKGSYQVFGKIILSNDDSRQVALPFQQAFFMKN